MELHCYERQSIAGQSQCPLASLVVTKDTTCEDLVKALPKQENGFFQQSDDNLEAGLLLPTDRVFSFTDLHQALSTFQIKHNDRIWVSVKNNLKTMYLYGVITTEMGWFSTLGYSFAIEKIVDITKVVSTGGEIKKEEPIVSSSTSTPTPTPTPISEPVIKEKEKEKKLELNFEAPRHLREKLLVAKTKKDGNYEEIATEFAAVIKDVQEQLEHFILNAKKRTPVQIKQEIQQIINAIEASSGPKEFPTGTPLINTY